MSDRVKSWLAAFVIGLLVVAIGPGREAVFQSLLSISSRTAVAEVTENELMHNECKYIVTFGEHEYTGRGEACGRFYVGQSMPVYVWAPWPAISSNQPPGTGLLMNFLFSLGGLVTASLVGLMRRTDDD